MFDATMSLDSSGEVYLMPFRPSNENKFTDLCGKSASLSLTATENEDPRELLEIRITDMSQDYNDSAFQHSKLTAANDMMSVVKQEIDLETLNRLLSKEVVCLSASRPIDSNCVLQTFMKQNGSEDEVRDAGTLPVVMYSKDLCILDHNLQNNDQDFENLKLSDDISLGADQDNLLVYSDEGEGNVLSSVQVMGLEHTDDNVWISDSSLLSLPSSALDSSSQIDSLDLDSNHLVPVKVEDSVVFISAAPSSGDASKPFSQHNLGSKEKVLLIGNSQLNESAAQNRPSVISVAAKTLQQAEEQHQVNAIKISSGKFSQDLNLSSSSPVPLLNKFGFQSLFKPKVVSSKNSRSVLKASVTGKQKSNTSLKTKPRVQIKKEGTLESMLTLSAKEVDLKSPDLNFTRLKEKKNHSLAVVAISSDKMKDLTEIVVSTSKGEQIFKGKTSELISATPNLWCLNNSKPDHASSPNLNYIGRSQELIGHDDDDDEDETIDDKPVTDALRRLGIPTLKWVQSKPEDDRVWFCPERDCKRLFSRLHLLKVHILGHYGVRPYKCDFPNCQWAFYTHFKLKRHKETHLQRKDFKCPVPDCGRSFSTVYNLNTHQKLHKRPAEICCPVENCYALFQTRRSLEFHLRIHGTDHAPYVCPYSSCQKRYYTVNSVNSHIRSHQHKDDEIKCQWAGCSKVFNKPCRLKAHMRTHTGDKPYSCSHPGCNWAFSSSSKLKRHQHKHTNVRNFECPLEGCGKLFMRSEHLKEHILTHSSERTFKCPHPNCNVKFSAKSSLYVHSKKHKAKLHGVVSAASTVDPLASIPVNVIKASVDDHDGGDGKCQNDVAKSSIENDIPDSVDVACPIPHCDESFLNVIDMREHVDESHSDIVPIEIPAATQTLDLIPLLSEDEALVAELASMDPVPFANDAVPSLRAEDSALCPPGLDNTSNVLSNLPEYMEDPGVSDPQMVMCSLDEEDKPVPDPLEQDEDLERVLNPASARSSITLNSWIEFKKRRQRQPFPFKQPKQPKRQAQQTQRSRKQLPLIPMLDEDHKSSQLGRTATNEGLSNLRAPLDVVLGAGLLGSGLLLPDDLASSSDIYSGEDGILSMDSSFVPSTINLRDLE